MFARPRIGKRWIPCKAISSVPSTAVSTIPLSICVRIWSLPSYKETADDLNRKYLGCFIYYDSKLVYCRQFEQDGSNIVGQLQIAGMKEKYQLVEIDPSKFVVTNLDGSIYLASQWFMLFH